MAPSAAGGPVLQALPQPNGDGMAHLDVEPLAYASAYSGASAPGPSVTFSYTGYSRPPNTFQQVHMKFKVSLPCAQC